MKKIVSISLGSSERDYEFTATFFGEEFHVRRVGTDGSADRARRMVREHDGQVDAIGLGGMAVQFEVGGRTYLHRPTLRIARAARYTPVVGGRGLRRLVDRWAIRDIARNEPGIFHRRSVLFLSGIASWDALSVIREHTDHLVFGDPILHFGVPTTLTSVSALDAYARASMPLLTRRPYTSFFPQGPSGGLQNRMLAKAVERAGVLVGDLQYVLYRTPYNLKDKIVVTDAIDSSSLAELRSRGVSLVCTTMPALAGDRTIGMGVLQAMMVAHLDKDPAAISSDDYLGLVQEMNLRPRIIHPQGVERRLARFGYVWIPNNREALFAHGALEVGGVLPKRGQKLMERVLARLPIGQWSRLTGIASDQGTDAEGWIYHLPWTPQMLERMDPKDVAERIEAIALEAESLGVRVLGLSSGSARLAEAGVRAASNVTLPITSGFSATASATLWAAREACLRMGFKPGKDGRFDKRALLIGVCGGWSEAAAILLAHAFRRITLVDRDSGRVLDLARRIEEQVPKTRVAVASELQPELASADLVLCGLAGPSRHLVDLDALRPGSVICDCHRPTEFSAEDQVARPDILIVRAGKLELPGAARYEQNLGLPDKVAPASLCEAAALALEGREECFTRGPEPTVESVKSIYHILKRHGFGLSGIHGVEGLLRDPEIALARAHGEDRLRADSEEQKPVFEVGETPPSIELRVEDS